MAAEIVQFRQGGTLALHAFASLFHEIFPKCTPWINFQVQVSRGMRGGEYFIGYSKAKRLSWSMIEPLHRLLDLSQDEYG